MSTFGAVTCVQTERLVCWCGELDLAALAAGVHSHDGGCLVSGGLSDDVVWGVGGVKCPFLGYIHPRLHLCL